MPEPAPLLLHGKSVRDSFSVQDTLRARQFFEKAIELSDGRDLSAKVELAQTYARLVYDRELHDRLLVQVVEADPRASGLTLFNKIAQEQARELLASADDYF